MSHSDRDAWWHFNSLHVVQIIPYGSVNHWNLQWLLAIRDSRVTMAREIAAFSAAPPSILSPHCAQDYL